VFKQIAVFNAELNAAEHCRAGGVNSCYLATMSSALRQAVSRWRGTLHNEYSMYMLRADLWVAWVGSASSWISCTRQVLCEYCMWYGLWKRLSH